MTIPPFAVDAVEARVEQALGFGRADEMDAVVAADSALRDLDPDYAAPQEPLALEEIADDLEDAILDDLSAPYARAAAIYCVARLYGVPTPTDFPLAEDALDEIGERLARVEEVAPCGCVAYRDGTGDPCPEHHPDGGRA